MFLNLNQFIFKSQVDYVSFYNKKQKMFNCYLKSSKEKKSFYQHKKLEMLNYIKDSLERKIASVTASIDVFESQISRDKEPEVTN